MGLSKLLLTLAAVVFAAANGATAKERVDDCAKYASEDRNLGKESSDPENSFFPYANCFEHDPDFGSNASETRNTIVPHYYRWPRGVIPYVWADTTSEEDKEVIRKGIALIQDATDSCLKFVERDGEINYLTIKSGTKEGCNTKLGMKGFGSQLVNLGEGCVYPSIAAHELLHAAGMFHEQSRSDRDEYIAICWDNVRKDSWGQYDKCDEDQKHVGCTTFGEPYNVRSIMQYPAYDGFPVDKTKPEMVSKVPGVTIPRSVLDNDKLTPQDVNKIKKMYGC